MDCFRIREVGDFRCLLMVIGGVDSYLVFDVDSYWGKRKVKMLEYKYSFVYVEDFEFVRYL